MIQTLVKSWWLMASCGVLEAVMSVIYFNHAGRGFHSMQAILFMGKLAIAAGACTIIAGAWKSTTGKCWLLVLNGLALSTLGLILNGIAGSRISFRTIALLIGVMATSIGFFELASARTLRRQHHVAGQWFLGFAGAVSLGFALGFLASVFRWINLEPGSNSDILWLGSYFGFSAIWMVGLALLSLSLRRAQFSQREVLPPLGNPKHAL